MIRVSRRIEAIMGFPLLASFIMLRKPIAVVVAKNPVPMLFSDCIGCFTITLLTNRTYKNY